SIPMIDDSPDGPHVVRACSPKVTDLSHLPIFRPARSVEMNDVVRARRPDVVCTRSPDRVDVDDPFRRSARRPTRSIPVHYAVSADRPNIIRARTPKTHQIEARLLACA